MSRRPVSEATVPAEIGPESTDLLARTLEANLKMLALQQQSFEGQVRSLETQLNNKERLLEDVRGKLDTVIRQRNKCESQKVRMRADCSDDDERTPTMGGGSVVQKGNNNARRAKRPPTFQGGKGVTDPEFRRGRTERLRKGQLKRGRMAAGISREFTPRVV